MLSLAKPNHFYQVRKFIWLLYPWVLPCLITPTSHVQVFLAQGLGQGLGLGLVWVPVATIHSHHFRKKRSLAVGIVLSGSAIGAVVFPISEPFYPFSIPPNLLTSFSVKVSSEALLLFPL
jgi:MFS family permease